MPKVWKDIELIKLFLDDVRNPPDSSWQVVRSYDSFVKFVLDNGVPDVISFDHDLAFEHYPFSEESATQTIPYDSYEEKTGYHAAKWLIERGVLPKVVVIHTLNPTGGDNLERLWKHRIGGYVYRFPYPHNESLKIK